MWTDDHAKRRPQDRPARRRGTRRWRGATTGGKPLTENGYFYPPTVLENVPVNASIAREEIFGPVAPVYKFESDDEAIRLANNTEYGLAAYIYSRDLKTCDDGRQAHRNPACSASTGPDVRPRRSLRRR